MPKAKAASPVVKTYTLEEARKLLADQKKTEKDARKGRANKRGFHADTVEETDMAYNVLAKGEYSNGDGRLVEFRAVMSQGGKVRLAAYPCGLWMRGVSVVADTVEDAAESLALLLAECAEALTDDATKTVVTLDKEYVRAAKTHEYIPPKRK